MFDGALRVLENLASTMEDIIAAGRVLRLIRHYMLGKTLITPQNEQERVVTVEFVKSSAPKAIVCGNGMKRYVSSAVAAEVCICPAKNQQYQGPVVGARDVFQRHNEVEEIPRI